MTPSTGFSTGEWQDQQKKQQPAAAPTTGQQQPTAAPQQPATPPPAPQTWGQHNTQHQERQRSYYGQSQPQVNPMSQQAQIQRTQQPQATPLQQAATQQQSSVGPYLNRTPVGSAPAGGIGDSSWAPADFSFAGGASMPKEATFGAPSGNALGAAAQQSRAISQPGSFLQDAQVDPLPPEMPQEMPKPQTAHHAMPQQTLRPPRSYYGQ